MYYFIYIEAVPIDKSAYSIQIEPQLSFCILIKQPIQCISKQ